ncbi:MAG: HlyD family efflux transporter periplasmic adaptor subunit [Candidatus Magasanikbacteria bacterium]|nr:HlyD family efflux transporter periplasmic adaptor subunit [Candidatus Magasanikbacteria bacterium]
MLKNIVGFIKMHKAYTLIAICIIGVGGNFAYKHFKNDKSATSYVLAAVTKGTLITSISGSGQISAVSQVDVKAKASGELTSISVKQGQEVRAGALLAVVDARDAVRSVRDAQTALETAKLELDKVLEPTDGLTVLQAENSLIQAKESKQKAEDDIKKSYEDGFNSVSNAFLALPTVMTGIQDILFANSFNASQSNIDFYAGAVTAYDDHALEYRDNASAAYEKARIAYDKNFQDYKIITRFSSVETIEAAISQTYDTTKLIAEAVKSANNLIQFYQDNLTEHNLKPNSLSNTHLSSLNSYTGTTNNHLSSLLAIEQSIESSKKSIISAQRSIEEKELSLIKIKNPADELDIRAKKIAIQQKQDALVAANQTLSDHYIRAPFAGVVAKITLKKGDSISSGGALLTLATKQHTAEISLNEVDVSKVAVGQKVTLTFDAIDALSIAGQVAEIDSIGTVSQGVVTYNVKILFDTQDDRVKSGMSVSAVIVTQLKQDVLLVASGAVKSQGTISYVEMFDKSQMSLEVQQSAGQSSQGVVSAVSPGQQIVEAGLSNDTQTEIVSGLVEGDMVVVRTISAANSKTTTQAPSILGNIGGARTGGGNATFRTQAR